MAMQCWSILNVTPAQHIFLTVQLCFFNLPNKSHKTALGSNVFWSLVGVGTFCAQEELLTSRPFFTYVSIFFLSFFFLSFFFVDPFAKSLLSLSGTGH
jgi:hypothetical protein